MDNAWEVCTPGSLVQTWSQRTVEKENLPRPNPQRKLDKEISLTKAEYEICEFLAKNRGQVFSKEQILEQIFGFDSESNDSTITTHIKNIRIKLSNYNYMPIKTVWGIGYKWEE